MDKLLAAKMAASLVGSKVGDWLIVGLVGSGKSAVVLRAERDGVVAALKVFDPDLIERFGETNQITRIEREKRLIAHTHPHVVRILDGGKCNVTGHLFVTMEHIRAKDLAQVISSVPSDKIWLLISQLASAARFLEELELAHRDIKPSNIAVTDDFKHLTLLDLGVLRPFGEAGLTDTDGQQFVGTLQYSSPEFLVRAEEDTVDGWKALTFYQLGAVLHDLIKGRPIFEEFAVPYARMVEAVKNETPIFDVVGADPDLIALARTCLVKDPKLRLKLVRWESFEQRPKTLSVATVRDRVKRRQRLATLGSSQSAPGPISHEVVMQSLVGTISRIIREVCWSDPDVFPPVEVHDHPQPEPGAVAFRAAFPKSSGKGIPVPFALLFQVRLLDPAANIVSISISAAVSADVREFAPDAFSPTSLVFCGPFEDMTVRDRVASALYIGTEAAIAHPVLEQGESRPLSIVISFELE